MTDVDAIAKALVARLATDAFFPPAEIDAEEPTDFLKTTPGLERPLTHMIAVQLPDDDAETTRDGGDDDTFEKYAELLVSYALGGPTSARTAKHERRALAKAKIVALIKADPTLGLEASVYARVVGATRNDQVFAPGSPPVTCLMVRVGVDYIAADEGG